MCFNTSLSLIIYHSSQNSAIYSFLPLLHVRCRQRKSHLATMCLCFQRRPPACHMSSPGMKSTTTPTVRHRQTGLPAKWACATTCSGGPLDRDRRWLFFVLFFSFAVAAKKQEEEEERARKEKAEKGLSFNKNNFQRNVEYLPQMKTRGGKIPVTLLTHCITSFLYIYLLLNATPLLLRFSNWIVNIAVLMKQLADAVMMSVCRQEGDDEVHLDKVHSALMQHLAFAAAPTHKVANRSLWNPKSQTEHRLLIEIRDFYGKIFMENVSQCVTEPEHLVDQTLALCFVMFAIISLSENNTLCNKSW